MGSRRAETSSLSVPAGWFVLLSVLVCVGAAGWLGVLLVGPQPASAQDEPRVTRSSVPPATDPTTASPTTEEPTTPEPTTEPTPEVERELAVSVLNNTRQANLARAFSAKVTRAGWTLGGLGNWRGQIVSNTVYYPEGAEDQAQLLADDVGIDRVLPAIVPMRTDRLTIILSGPQQ